VCPTHTSPQRLRLLFSSHWLATGHQSISETHYAVRGRAMRWGLLRFVYPCRKPVIITTRYSCSRCTTQAIIHRPRINTMTVTRTNPRAANLTATTPGIDIFTCQICDSKLLIVISSLTIVHAIVALRFKICRSKTIATKMSIVSILQDHN